MAQLDVVVEKPDAAARKRRAEDRQRRQRVVGEREKRNRGGRDDQQPAHRRGALLGGMVLEPFLADVLAKLVPAQERDERRAAEDRDDHGNERGDKDSGH